MINLSRYWLDFVDLLFPRCCEACHKALVGTEEIICTSCRITLPRLASDSVVDLSVKNKFMIHPEVQGAFSYLIFTKKGKVQELLYALKYKGSQDVGKLLGNMYGQELKDQNLVPTADLIISVPLHPRRQKERGYNQSDAFAEGLSEATGILWSGTVLARMRYTKTQTGKSRSERYENMSGVFRINKREAIAGKRIILVDDVLTTGATLDACVEAMKGLDCTIYIMTIAAAQT
ncbi:ComF family protein [Telluribacter sp.]|jgi:ComF family protein|uniref:ComF family protein n=1 Tax=Telluribacter sp. TaxID=1978767 RepID=UPI002E1583FF|nr:phosphoribosyltransferase family protein [Telluribacter sp.]